MKTNQKQKHIHCHGPCKKLLRLCHACLNRNIASIFSNGNQTWLTTGIGTSDYQTQCQQGLPEVQDSMSTQHTIAHCLNFVLQRAIHHHKFGFRSNIPVPWGIKYNTHSTSRHPCWVLSLFFLPHKCFWSKVRLFIPKEIQACNLTKSRWSRM
jgi:hypothetical protein